MTDLSPLAPLERAPDRLLLLKPSALRGHHEVVGDHAARESFLRLDLVGLTRTCRVTAPSGTWTVQFHPQGLLHGRHEEAQSEDGRLLAAVDRRTKAITGPGLDGEGYELRPSRYDAVGVRGPGGDLFGVPFGQGFGNVYAALHATVAVHGPARTDLHAALLLSLLLAEVISTE